MKMRLSEITLWKYLFFGLIPGYCLLYAPFGVNETDGGFLTGLGWQVISGKMLYQDIIYVRPPLPVWLRALEIQCLPEYFEVLGERWIFYWKLGLYSWLGAALLYTGQKRWILATFGFVISAHCYPAMAWHTVDGILFAVLAAYLYNMPGTGKFSAFQAFLGGIALFASLMCKQSFYPLLMVFGFMLYMNGQRKAISFLAGFTAAVLAFISYLVQYDLLQGFLDMTTGAATGGQAFQHGVLDYFRITPELALPSLGLWFWSMRLDGQLGSGKRIALMWAAWLLALVGSYAAITWLRQDHTAPFAQSRALFWVTVWWISALWVRSDRKRWDAVPKPVIPSVLLGITWCAAISWGYNLPMLFSTPWVWAVMDLSDTIGSQQYVQKTRMVLLAALLLAFAVGYQFVYRDGQRREMTVHMGDVFPQLTGIYSTPESAALYRDLKNISARYPHFTVLPAFPQANYLTGTTPPLPLDWVVNRETNGDNALIYKVIKEKHPVLLIEKNYLPKLMTDPQLEVTRFVLEQGKTLEESDYFIVKQL